MIQPTTQVAQDVIILAGDVCFGHLAEVVSAGLVLCKVTVFRFVLWGRYHETY